MQSEEKGASKPTRPEGEARSRSQTPTLTSVSLRYTPPPTVHTVEFRRQIRMRRRELTPDLLSGSQPLTEQKVDKVRSASQTLPGRGKAPTNLQGKTVSGSTDDLSTATTVIEKWSKSTMKSKWTMFIARSKKGQKYEDLTKARIEGLTADKVANWQAGDVGEAGMLLASSSFSQSTHSIASIDDSKDKNLQKKLKKSRWNPFNKEKPGEIQKASRQMGRQVAVGELPGDQTSMIWVPEVLVVEGAQPASDKRDEDSSATKETMSADTDDSSSDVILNTEWEQGVIVRTDEIQVDEVTQKIKFGTGDVYVPGPTVGIISTTEPEEPTDQVDQVPLPPIIQDEEPVKPEETKIADEPSEPILPDESKIVEDPDEPVEPSEPILPDEPETIEDPSEPSEPSEPILPDEPEAVVEPSEPDESSIGSIEPSEPVLPDDTKIIEDPEEPVEPSEPILPDESKIAEDTDEPVEPSDEVEPSEPVLPDETKIIEDPEEPVEPSEPTLPEEPEAVVEPSEPVEPDESIEPSEPELPDESKIAEDLSEPDEPSDPILPEDPDSAYEPSEPIEPSEPVLPDESKIADDSDEQPEPSEPVLPDETKIVEDPEEPVEPSEPILPDEPEEPVKTSEPDEKKIAEDPILPDESKSIDEPIEPLEPSEVVEPSEPVEPDEPEAVVEPSEPVVPDDQISTDDEPIVPDDAKDEKPSREKRDVSGQDPDEPLVPSEPEEPEIPEEKPIVPDDSPSIEEPPVKTEVLEPPVIPDSGAPEVAEKKADELPDPDITPDKEEHPVEPSPCDDSQIFCPGCFRCEHSHQVGHTHMFACCDMMVSAHSWRSDQYYKSTMLGGPIPSPPSRPNHLFQARIISDPNNKASDPTNRYVIFISTSGPVSPESFSNIAQKIQVSDKVSCSTPGQTPCILAGKYRHQVPVDQAPVRVPEQSKLISVPEPAATSEESPQQAPVQAPSEDPKKSPSQDPPSQALSRVRGQVSTQTPDGQTYTFVCCGVTFELRCICLKINYESTE